MEGEALRREFERLPGLRPHARRGLRLRVLDVAAGECCDRCCRLPRQLLLLSLPRLLSQLCRLRRLRRLRRLLRLREPLLRLRLSGRRAADLRD